MATLELEARLDNLLSTSQKETEDIDLFASMPEREECPLCLVPFPFEHGTIVYAECCGKNICGGCIYKNMETEADNSKGDLSKVGLCAFCRQPPIRTAKAGIKAIRKQMKKNNPGAFMEMSGHYILGEGIIQSDTKALEMYSHAAELGEAEAYEKIGHYYDNGKVVEQDKSKAKEFYEIAAKKGSVNAHRILSTFHGMNGNIDESIRHCKVAACAGDKESMDRMMEAYKDKLLSKEDLTQTLREYQTSSNTMKTTDRDNARRFHDIGNGNMWSGLGIDDYK